MMSDNSKEYNTPIEQSKETPKERLVKEYELTEDVLKQTASGKLKGIHCSNPDCPNNSIYVMGAGSYCGICHWAMVVG